ncbi:ATP-binding protein [Candidatus Uhrbacteria bacterium]|nr:ATP-binding protein [Candidatus Uhrbacteria bacterium]MBD3283818.1 ATP-binding protein [Candidatus Uhrbacteria bacterium]
MRIAFVGKGGSGKTTSASLFAQYVAGNGHPTFVIDADLNQHLLESLGFKGRPQQQLGNAILTLKEELIGSNMRMTASEMLKTTPPGKGSRIFQGTEDLTESLPSFVISERGISAAAVGAPEEEDIGIRCYHGKTGTVELILNHLVDHEDEYVIVDMTAGIDAFSSGLYDKFDLTVLIVEPTQKSVQVFEQYQERAQSLGLALRALGNKIQSEQDEQFLQERLGSALLSSVKYSDQIRSLEQGISVSLEELLHDQQSALEAVKRTLDDQPKDWARYLQRTTDMHIKTAQSWANQSMGKRFEDQIDPTFSYPVRERMRG